MLPENQKGAATILLTLILATILAFGVYKLFLVTKKPEVKLKQPETKTINEGNIYKTTAFQFSYPRSLTLLEDSEEQFNIRGKTNFRKNFTGYVAYSPPKFIQGIVVQSPNDNTPQFDSAPFTLWIFENTSHLSAETWYKDYWYYPFVWGEFSEPQKGQIKPTGEASISGQMSKSAIVRYRPNQPKFIYLPYKDKMYLFRIIDKDGFGNKILSSFKLID